jgi:hypothetical protein
MPGHSKARRSTERHAQARCDSWTDFGTARFRVRTATTKLWAPSRTDTEQETISKIRQIASAGVLVWPQMELACLSTGSDGRDISLQLASGLVCVQNVHALTLVICLQAPAWLRQTRLCWQIVGAIKMEKASLFQKKPRTHCAATSQTSGEDFRLEGLTGRPA